jgi:cyclic pyranopterin phosphate synthase
MPAPGAPGRPMLDWSRRKIDYLRISITDRCNERCLYCMPQGLKDWKERAEILSYEEILRVVEIVVSLGFSKFRITGGEPLVRKGAVGFLERLGAVPGVQSLGLSTNATLLAPAARKLRDAGIDSINISLDTLDPEEYRRITLKDLSSAIEGIDAAVQAGFPRVKLNTVLLRGSSEEQLLPIIRFARERGAIVRFIELMPLTTTEVLTQKNFLSVEEAKARIGEATPLERADIRVGHGPAVYYRTGEGDLIGFIGAMTDLHFCDACNKIRLTADGKIRPCLGNHLEFDLKSVLRGGGSAQDVADVFRRTLGLKPADHEFRNQYQPGRHMTAIGG